MHCVSSHRWRMARRAGIAGLAGIREGSHNTSGMHTPANLPSTLTVADSSYPSQPTGGGYPSPHRHESGGAAYAHAANNYHGYQQAAPAGSSLPETLNVMSIIDQPPAQSSSYGISSGQAPPGYAPVAPLQAPPPVAQWQTHFTLEGRPYYFDPSTGQSVWDPPQ
jgi:hypothetical protein